MAIRSYITECCLFVQIKNQQKKWKSLEETAKKVGYSRKSINNRYIARIKNMETTEPTQEEKPKFTPTVRFDRGTANK